MATRAAVTVEVRVELKPGILDPEAESVEKSLRLLGVDRLARVETARVYRLSFERLSKEEARERAARAVDRLLANPVVHRVSVTDVPT
ncbi:MAG: phosphoribosylformylglycinamidine synthase subunit PurS [Thermoplasmata archaeon]|nr:phosphoribosylformylglycinamidine synthase subunit PurS [Thermoplasmata archaeon]